MPATQDICLCLQALRPILCIAKQQLRVHCLAAARLSAQGGYA